MIYELITALQLTSKYFFTYLSIKRPFFPLQHLVSYLVLIFISVTVLSSGAISGAGPWHNALKCSDSPKTLHNKTTFLHLDSETVSRFFFDIASFASFHLHSILSHTTSTLIHYLVPLLRRGFLIGCRCCLRRFLQVRDIGKVILLGHTNGQSQDDHLPFTGSPRKKYE